MLGITQQQMAELIGVTFQQAHKYEKGLNRLSVARLFTVAEALGTSVTELLANLEPAGKLPSPTRTQQRNLKLASAFASLTSHEQTAVLSMVRLMARKDAA
jgi:transcriptional regulator with XRE-family HTH domain